MLPGQPDLRRSATRPRPARRRPRRRARRPAGRRAGEQPVAQARPPRRARRATSAPGSSTSWRARTSPRRSQIAPRRKRAPRSSPSTSAASCTGSKNVAPYFGPVGVVVGLAHQPGLEQRLAAPPTPSAWRCPTRREISAREIGAPVADRLQHRALVEVAQQRRGRGLRANAARRSRRRTGAARTPGSAAARTRSPRSGARRASTRATSRTAPAGQLGAAEHVRVRAELLDHLDLGVEPLGRELQRLRPHADDHARRARSRAARQLERHARRTRPCRRRRAARVHEVHRRRADEAGHERVDRAVEQRARRVALLQRASRSTATRWPSVIASAWSWVT